MDFFGLLIGVATLFIIGLGFPLVMRGEYHFGYLAWPYMLGIGLLLVLLSLFVATDWLSALVGVLGATFVWGSTELKEQAVRTELGWYAFNPHKKKLPFESIIKRWKAPHL
jgi:lysylphosphatidylglycerol synthetase-like protein (DUF2156 family)